MTLVVLDPASATLLTVQPQIPLAPLEKYPIADFKRLVISFFLSLKGPSFLYVSETYLNEW